MAACSNPLPFGPGRVAINLDRAEVLDVDHATLFPGSPKDPAAPERREALRLVISSQTELLTYFEEWDRQVQVRCAVDGNLNRKSYSGFAIGPLPEGQGTSIGSNATVHKPYRYTVYAFIDLKADDVQYEGGKPASTLNLKTETFGSLKCHLLGVTKAPVLFPRSNDVVLPASTFRTLLRQGNVR
jgi:hypothetical protein